MRVSNTWHNFHFWVNYPFNIQSWDQIERANWDFLNPGVSLDKIQPVSEQKSTKFQSFRFAIIPTYRKDNNTSIVTHRQPWDKLEITILLLRYFRCVSWKKLVVSSNLELQKITFLRFSKCLFKQPFLGYLANQRWLNIRQKTSWVILTQLVGLNVLHNMLGCVN